MFHSFGIVLVCTFAFAGFGAVAADRPAASDHAYTQGSVWKITHVQTKPGRFDDYINDLARVFQRFNEAQKATGRVLSYKVLRLSDARDGEPNLILMVEYPNYAVLDTPDEVWDEARKALFGTMKQEHGAAIDREALRTLRGDVYVQELNIPIQTQSTK
jgi:hypothetical protein